VLANKISSDPTDTIEMEESRASSTVVKRSWDAANCSRTLLVSVMSVMDVILPGACIYQGRRTSMKLLG
jgi:hypothetical protein